MEILKRLRPVEAKFLMYPSSSTFRDLIKLNLLDLSLRKVLKITKVTDVIDGEQVFSYTVARGENYIYDGNSPTEALFTFAFCTPVTKDTVLDMSELVKIVYQTVKSESNFKKKYLRKSKVLEPLFEQGFWMNLFYTYRRTKEGAHKSKQLKDYLDELQSKIDSKQLDEQEKMSMLNLLGTNVLLLNGVDSEFLEGLKGFFDKEFDKRGRDMEGQFRDIGDTFVDGFDLIIMDEIMSEDIFESFSDSLDSAYDSADSLYSSDSDGGFFGGDSFDGGDSGGGDSSGCSSGCGGGCGGGGCS